MDKSDTFKVGDRVCVVMHPSERTNETLISLVGQEGHVWRIIAGKTTMWAVRLDGDETDRYFSAKTLQHVNGLERVLREIT